MENIELKADIECAKNLLDGVPNKKRFSERNKVYPFTTEKIGRYLKFFNLKNKKLLTVTSSGDHTFNAILLGVREIDCFDINRLTIHYMKLKKAGIMTLDFKDFVNFFTSGNQQTYNPTKYEKVREKLDNDTKLFWDSIYEKAIKQNTVSPGDFIVDSNLFFKNCDFRICASDNYYLSKNGFNKLKGIIGDAEISYINSDLLALPKVINTQYDLIMLSNISDYLELMFFNYPLDEYRDFIINDLSKLLGIDGQIILAYIYWCNIPAYSSVVGNINNSDKRSASFDEYFSSIVFSGTDESSIYKINPMDAIYVYKKSQEKR